MSIIDSKDDSVEYSPISQEFTPRSATCNRPVVDIVSTITLGAMQLHTVVLPSEWVVGSTKFFQTVGALSVVGHKTIETAHTHDDTVVGTKFTGSLRLLFASKHDVFCGIVVVTGGLKMAHALYHTTLHLGEMTRIAENTRQLAGQGMERGVEDEITLVFT